MTFLRPAARQRPRALPTRPPQGFRPLSLPGRALPSGPLRPERPRSLRPVRLSARPASTPGRGDRRPGGNLPGGRSARPPFPPAPCDPPAARGMPISSGGPTDRASPAPRSAAERRQVEAHVGQIVHLLFRRTSTPCRVAMTSNGSIRPDGGPYKMHIGIPGLLIFTTKM